METQTRKVPPRGTPERREYDRKKKAASRNRLRTAREIVPIQNARDYVVPDAWQVQLDAASQAAETAIRAELGQVTANDVYIITGVSQVLYGLRNGLTQQVAEPTGVVIGGLYADALGSEAVKYVHQHPALLGSPTFNRLYRDFLAEVVRWSRTVDPRHLTPEFIADVQGALDGTYVLPEPAIPPAKQPPDAAPEQSPTDAQIRADGHRKLTERLYGDASKSYGGQF